MRGKEESSIARLLTSATFVGVGLGMLLLFFAALGFLGPQVYAQTLVLLLAVTGYVSLLAAGIFIHRIQKHLDPLIQGRRDVETLLNTLSDGVFVFGSDGKIQAGCSEAAKTMFGVDPTGRHFIDVLKIAGPGREAVQRWLELTFSQVMPFEDLIPLAPKSFERLNSRYISLDYRAIYNRKRVLTKVMVIASDRTNELSLREQSEVERSMASLVTIILKDRNGFGQFIKDARRILQELNALLSQEPSSVGFETVMRNIHTLKSISYQYHILHLHRATHQFEGELNNIQSEGGHRFQDFVPVLQRGVMETSQEFEAFLRENENLIGVVDKVEGDKTKSLSMKSIYRVSEILSERVGADSDAYQEFLKEFVLEDFANGFEKYRDMVHKLADRQSKVIDFQLIFSGIQVCTDSYQTLISAMVHVFRNAVDHGIEPTVERSKLNKPAKGTIRINFERIQLKQGGPRVRIKVVDDGRGIDEKLLRDRLLERGILEEARAGELSRESLLQYIFHHGMSTRGKANQFSGRGVGLDTVKYEASKLGGTAWVESEKGKGSTIFVEVPVYESPVFRPVEIENIRKHRSGVKKKAA